MEYANYICDQCAREKQERKKRGDEATWERLRQEMENAIANGAPQPEIDTKTSLYNYWSDYMFKTYGISANDQ